MKYCFSVTLQPCGSCVSHSHCKECCSRAEEDLSSYPSLQKIVLDPAQKTLIVETDLAQDLLEDLMDDKGVYVLANIPL